jgi:hypothetical protein
MCILTERMSGLDQIREAKGQRTYDNRPMLNRVSLMPVVCALARSTSVSVGTYEGVPIRSTSVKKLRISQRKGRESNLLDLSTH